MKINWKLRFKNKATFVAFITTFISFVYVILDAIGVVPKFDETTVVKAALCLIDLLAMMGIFVDPTTKGVSDSDRAMGYDKPAESTPDDEDLDEEV